MNLSENKANLLKKWKSGKKASETIQRLYLDKSILSSSQQRVWYLEQLFPDTAAYNMYICFSVSPPLQTSLVKEAFSYLVKRQEMLRVRFSVSGENTYQVIGSGEDIQVDEFYCETRPLAEKKAELISKIPFDLINGPLVRLSLIFIGNKEQLLLLTMHHLISDGWSLNIFFNEFEHIYKSLLEGNSIALPDLAVSYFDYIQWQNARIESSKVREQIEYWKNSITKNNGILNIPRKKVSFEDTSGKGKRVVFELPEAELAKLESFVKSSKTTLYMVLLSVFSVLLYRYTRQSDITIGSPIANRSHKSFQNLIGFFVNILALRIHVDGDARFCDFLNQVKTVTQGAYSNQDMPFEKIIEILEPERNLSASPLFTVAFVFQNVFSYESKISGTRTNQVLIHNGTSKFDLLLTTGIVDKKLIGAFEYNSELYEEKFIGQLANLYRKIVRFIIDHSEVKINSIPLIDHQKLNVFAYRNQANSHYALKSIIQYFSESVRKNVNAIALIDHNQSITYGELDKRSDQLANFLINKHSVKEGKLIGISLLPSIDLIVSILAVLKMGCGYVPLDPKSPKKRLSYICENSALELIVTRSELDNASLNVKTVNINDYESIIEQTSCDRFHISIDPEKVAYVIYTSGSTGNPKGVLVSHRNVTRLFMAAQSIYQFDEKDIWCLFHSPAFDFSVWEIWGALFHGAKLVILSEEEKREVPKLFDVLQRNKVTVLNQTPLAFKQLCSEQKRRPNEKLENLRYLIFGGAKLDLKTLIPWFEFYNDQTTKVYNMYGITETTVHVTYRQILRNDIDLPYSPIGKPLDDLSLYLLDSELRPVPVGVVGELFVGGSGVSLGYLNNKKMTEERFIGNPLIAGERIYKTGDLAREREGGELEYVGRCDDQVKVRGYRIELGEVEYNVEQHPMVQHCLVRATKNVFNEEELVAYVVLDKDKISLLDEKTLETFQNEQMLNWNTIFDEYYSTPAHSNNYDFNINGWLSSYTREMISDQEMREWVDNTVEKILSYQPKKVLEIGCGTGLLLSRIAPFTDLYVGTDLSSEALSYVKKNLISQRNNLQHVKLVNAKADDSINIDEQFDMVILNSVCQYFPSEKYFIKVIQSVLPYVSDQSLIFIGDVRNHALDNIFHTSVALYNSSEKDKVEDVRNDAELRLRQDTELTLMPQFFYKLVQEIDRVTNVQLMYKKGLANNELNNYRYDVILTVGPIEVQGINKNYMPNSSGELLIEEIKNFLENNQKEPVLRISQVMNPRIEKEVEQYIILAHCEGSQNIGPIKNIETREDRPNFSKFCSNTLSIDHKASSFRNLNMFHSLYSIANQFSKNYILVPNHQKPEYVDIVFMNKEIDPSRLPMPEDITGLTYHELMNNPLAGKFYKEWSSQIRSFLKDQIPEHMIPSKYIAIQKIPLTINGKVDETKLPMVKRNTRNKNTKDLIPQTDVEKIVVSIFSEILEVKDVGLCDDFFELGGHSILAARVTMRLSDHFQRTIPLRMLLLNPRVGELAFAIETMLINDKDSFPEEIIDLEKDIQLSSDIFINDYSLKSLPDASLLTGATGFVGVFLLKELLNKTKGPVYCLIRPTKKERGWDRLERALKNYSLFDKTEKNRIIVIEGDLSKPYFGLSSFEFLELSKKIGVIYHNGAEVNFSYPYSLLKSSNVFGTEVVLRFAALGIKPLNFISTLFVFNEKDCQDSNSIIESQEPRHFSELHLGYTQSKWVAEKLILSARERGIPANIFRLGRISGSTLTGACQTKDFFWSMVRLGLKLNNLPQWNRPIDILPVDIACNAIISLSQENSINQQYHLNNPNPATSHQLVHILRTMGYLFTISPMEIWKKTLNVLLEKSELDEESKNLVSIITKVSVQDALNFDTSQTIMALRKLSINIPPVADLLPMYCRYFYETSYFSEKLSNLISES